MSYELDFQAYERRLTRMYDTWKSNDLLSQANALFMNVGTAIENELPPKGSLLQLWLFGFEFPDTFILFKRKEIHILSSVKKINILKQIQEKSTPEMPQIHFYERKKDDRNVSNFSALLSAAAQDGTALGMFSKDKYASELTNDWQAYIGGSPQDWSQFSIVDISSTSSLFFGIKEADELEIIRDSAVVSTEVMARYARIRIENFINSGKAMKHVELSEDMEKAIKTMTYTNKYIEKEYIDIAYAPIIQSGERFDLRPSAESDEEFMRRGTIICSVGVTYKTYNSNISRTFMVNPTRRQCDNYNFLLQLQAHIISNLTPGKSIADVYNAGVAFAAANRPELEDHLTKTFGFGIGLEFRESTLIINAKCTRLVESGMVFNVAVGLEKLEDAREGLSEQEIAKSKKIEKMYALLVADMVIVHETGTDPEILTAAPKALKDARHVLDEEMSKEERRKVHQTDLLKKILDTKMEQLNSQGGSSRPNAQKFASSVAYKRQSDLPRDPAISRYTTYVDKEKNAVIIPVYGVPVPFHIDMIKSVVKNEEANFHYLRFNFNVPTQAAMDTMSGVPKAAFLGEISIRSKDGRNLAKVLADIKDLQKKAKALAAEKKEMEDLVEQEELVLNRSQQIKTPRLGDILMRPPLVPRKAETGYLEAHVNGFRYTCKGEQVDIIYGNIKHAIFQPCKNENFVVIHFHLKHPILIGRKKHKDIQYYVEIVGVDDLGQRRGRNRDRDEFEEEEREREKRMRMNDGFRKFCERAREISNNNVEFDGPQRELAFYGVPTRSNVQIFPGVHCLFSITDQPAFVVSLDDIEVVYLERIQLNLKSFDIVLIFKDYYRPVVHINSVPTHYLDTVRNWVDSMDIFCIEGPINLNWSAVMKQVTDDIPGFIADGGWSHLAGADDADGDDEDDEEDESEFEASDDEEESSEDDFSADESASDDSDDYSEDDSEESGKDWSELEEEARLEEERKRRRDSDSDDEDRRKKKRTKSPPPKNRRR